MEWITTLLDFTAEQTGWNRDLAAAGLSSLPSALLWTVYYLVWGRRSRTPQIKVGPTIIVETYIPSDLVLKLRDYLKDWSKPWTYSHTQPEYLMLSHEYHKISVENQFLFCARDNKLVYVELNKEVLPGLNQKDYDFLQPFFLKALNMTMDVARVKEVYESEKKEKALLVEAQEILNPPAPKPEVVVHTYVKEVPYIPHELTIQLCKLLDDPNAAWTYEGTYREGHQPIQKIKLGSLEIHTHKPLQPLGEPAKNWGLVLLKQDGVDISSGIPYKDFSIIDLSLHKRMTSIMARENSLQAEQIKAKVSQAVDSLSSAAKPKPTLSAMPIRDSQNQIYSDTWTISKAGEGWAVASHKPQYERIMVDNVEYTLFKGTPVFKNSTYHGSVNGKEVQLYQFMSQLYSKATA